MLSSKSISTYVSNFPIYTVDLRNGISNSKNDFFIAYGYERDTYCSKSDSILKFKDLL